MKWIALLIAIILCAIPCSVSQQDQYSNQYMNSNPYSNNTSGGAPTPVAPTSPDALGLGTPSVTSLTSAQQTSTDTHQLMKTDQQAAYSAPSGLQATSTSLNYTQMVVPADNTAIAPNHLYIFYAPLTVAGCNLYASVPLWLQISGQGDLWIYEWYPSGSLQTNYAGYTYTPDWYKWWFVADTPGWHILQYYCNGWSNYAYVYVYGSGGGVSPAPTPVTPVTPVNPDEAECEKDPWCSWINGKCVCESFTPPDNSERQSCEKKPYCNWVNSKCLCTGLMPSTTYGGDSKEVAASI